MNTIQNYYVIQEINDLKPFFPFGFKHKGEFIPLNKFSVNGIGKTQWFYINENNEQKSVASYMKLIKRISTVRCLNHLCFKDGYDKVHNFKKYVSEKHGLTFT